MKVHWHALMETTVLDILWWILRHNWLSNGLKNMAWQGWVCTMRILLVGSGVMRAKRPTTASQRLCLPIPEARYRWFRHLEAPNHGYLPPRLPRVFLGQARHISSWTLLPVLLRTVD